MNEMWKLLMHMCIRIKQVDRLLGYEDLQVLEVFKNTVPNRLYWVLFSFDNLHDAVIRPLI